MISSALGYRGVALGLPLRPAGCTASQAAPIQLPSRLPLTTDDEQFDVRWVLEPGPGASLSFSDGVGGPSPDQCEGAT